MKKDQSPDSTSLFQQSKDTKKRFTSKGKAVKNRDSFTDEAVFDKDNSKSTAENNATELSKKLLDFLHSHGHTSRIVAYSPRLWAYQISIFDFLPFTKVKAIRKPGRSASVKVDILVNVHDEWIKLLVRFKLGLKKTSGLEPGRYDLEINNFDQFREWYTLTFGRGQL